VDIVGGFILSIWADRPLKGRSERLSAGHYSMRDVQHWMGYPELRAQLQARLRTEVPLLVGDVEEMNVRAKQLGKDAHVTRLHQQTRRFVQRNAKSACADLTGL
jgi:hypothetical protein